MVSHFFCMYPSPLKDLSVSIDDKVSIKIELRNAVARVISSVDPSICLRTERLFRTINRNTTAGTITNGQAIHDRIKRNMSANGKSIRLATVADEAKSRMDSNDRRVWANDPTDAGRSAIFIPSTLSIMIPESFTSILEPARSIKYERIFLITKSNITTIITPMANIHRVSIALPGITRS